ncbi:MAG: hypothetical protein U5J64_01585 [Halobacteriales archaeon]|nr:hypothetical protein [Halobacteriales archaeon]
MGQTKTRGVKEVVPYAFMVTVGFFIAGFVTYALYNGVVNMVFPPAYSNNWTFIGGWLAAWVVVGLLISLYMGRK